MVDLLMISGSLRHGSTNTAALVTASVVAPPGVALQLYGGTAHLPHFNPDDEGSSLPPLVADLRARIRQADALLLSTPEYAGALPGSFKNVFDWAVGDDQPGSLNQKPVAYINVSPRGGALAHASLRAVLGYVGALIMEKACVDIPLRQSDIDHEGLIASDQMRRQLAVALTELIAGIPDVAR
jgi:chromate reductase, NAD(P)H dehydrogenase (quinone)